MVKISCFQKYVAFENQSVMSDVIRFLNLSNNEIYAN